MRSSLRTLPLGSKEPVHEGGAGLYRQPCVPAPTPRNTKARRWDPLRPGREAGACEELASHLGPDHQPSPFAEGHSAEQVPVYGGSLKPIKAV